MPASTQLHQRTMDTPSDPLAAIPEDQRRRLKQLADAEAAIERRKHWWAKRLAVLFASLIALYLLGVLYLGFPGRH